MKTNLILAGSILAASLAPSAAAAPAPDCAQRAASIGVEYEIRTPDARDPATRRRSFGFWRTGVTVVHEYPAAGIADVWFRTADGRLKSTRYFDEAERAIEYQPGDLNHGHGLRNWSEKSQLVSQGMIDLLREQARAAGHVAADAAKASAEGAAAAEVLGDDPCRRVEWLRGEVNGQSMLVGWMPALRIPYALSASVGGKPIAQWRLTRLVDDGNAEIVARQRVRARFKEIDFGDIGDAETDPFFGKLIHMGFVEHGHSGFYDSDGHAHGHDSR
ncbi:MAG: hypothetical protein R3E87_21555 [Burkholderiaceae bacterium]